MIRSPVILLLKTVALALLLKSSAFAGQQFIDMGTTSLLSGINQPYVEFAVRSEGQVFGPSESRNKFLLDTGATSILVVGQAAGDLHNSAGEFDQGEFLEQGVSGFVPYKVSAPYTVDVRADQGTPVTLDQMRILSDPSSNFGPGVGFQGIVGMPAMAGRVTTMAMGASSSGGLLGGGDLLGGGLLGGLESELFGSVLLGGFGSLLGGDLEGFDTLGLGGDIFGLGQVPGGDDLLGLDQLLGGLGGLDGLLGDLSGLLFGGLGDLGGLLGTDLGGLDGLLGGTGIDLSALSNVEVSFSDGLPASNGHRYGVSLTALSFDSDEQTVRPSSAPLAVVKATHYQDAASVTRGNYVVDTGAQMSIINTDTARKLNLNLARPDSSVPISGVGGITSAPVFRIDRLGVLTDTGTELVWNDVQVIVLDIDPKIDGVIGAELFSSSEGAAGGLDLLSLEASSGAVDQVHFDFRRIADGSGTMYIDLNSSFDRPRLGTGSLRAGDANLDFQFNQLDIVQVLQRGKYLTGLPATWGDGDWDAAPGGSPEDPPAGNGIFDQLDVVASLRGGVYNTGPYGAVQPGGESGDGQTSLVYDAATGEVSVDAPSGFELTSINIDSANGIFTADPAINLGGSFDNDTNHNIFKATFGGSFGSLSLGDVATVGLSEQFLLSDLTVVGSLAGGGALGEVDLIYVPEPSALLLLAFGLWPAMVPRRRP